MKENTNKQREPKVPQEGPMETVSVKQASGTARMDGVLAPEKAQERLLLVLEEVVLMAIKIEHESKASSQ